MIIKFSPVRMGKQLNITRFGDIITFNGEEFDFSPLPDCAVLPASAIDCKWITGEVSKTNGELELTIILPHGANAPYETRFPTPIQVYLDGPVTLPLYDIPVEDEEVIHED